MFYSVHSFMLHKSLTVFYDLSFKDFQSEKNYFI